MQVITATSRAASPSTSLSRPSSRQLYSPKVKLPPLSPEEKSLIKPWSKDHVILDSGKQTHVHNLSIFLSYDSSSRENMEKVDFLREKLIEKGYVIYEHDGTAFPCRFNEIDSLTKDNVRKCCGYVAFISREFYKNRYCKLLAQHAFKLVSRQKRKVFETMFIMLQGSFTTFSVPEKIGGWLQFLIKDSLWYPGWNVPHLDGAFASIEKVVSLLALEVDIECHDVMPVYGHKANSNSNSKPSSRASKSRLSSSLSSPTLSSPFCSSDFIGTTLPSVLDETITNGSGKYEESVSLFRKDATDKEVESKESCFNNQEESNNNNNIVNSNISNNNNDAGAPSSCSGISGSISGSISGNNSGGDEKRDDLVKISNSSIKEQQQVATTPSKDAKEASAVDPDDEYNDYSFDD